MPSNQKQRGGKKLPKNAQGALDDGILKLEEFLAGREPTISDPDRVITDISTDDGSVSLDHESRVSFHEILDAFERFAELSRKFMVRTVHTAVEDAIINHFDARDVEATVTALRKKLNGPAESFTVYVPAVGFAKGSVPGEFGGVPIVSLEEARERLLDGKSADRAAALREAMKLWPWSPPPMTGALFVLQVDQAVEAEAAQEIALERARELADILNFFSDGSQSLTRRIRVAESRGRAVPSSVVMSVRHANGDIHATHVHAGSVLGFDPTRQTYSPAWQPADEMLAKPGRNEVEALLITSMRWSGRATTEPRRDIAFTQFAIALESLMLPAEHQELTEKLATRVARLLAPNLRGHRSAMSVYREVKDYYKLRSKIVHDGGIFVSNVDLFGMHRLTKWVTRWMVSICRAQGFSTIDELNNWLVELVLGTTSS